MSSEETQKSSKKNKKAKEKRKLDIQALAIIDNIVFNKTEAIAYYKLSNKTYDFRPADSKALVMQQITNSFNTLMNDRQEPLKMHLINTTVPIDVGAWREQIDEFSKIVPRPPGFNDFIREQNEFLRNRYYTKQTIYLGINLGKRGALNTNQINIFETGVKAAVDFGKEWLSKALSLPTEEISESEERSFRKYEEAFFQNISVGHLKGTRCTSEEVLLLFKSPLYPMMPPPYLDIDHGNRLGDGDILLECGGVIENRYRWLKIEQMIDEDTIEDGKLVHTSVQRTGYRATLSMSKFPRRMKYPSETPFLMGLKKMGFPFTTYAHFELLPSKKMKSDLEKKKKSQIDEVKNMASAADSYNTAVSGVDENVANAIEDQQVTSSILSEDSTSWFKGTFYIAVEAPDEKMLRKFVSVIKQAYTDIDVSINWTSGDQLDLFLSQMPGDKKRIKSFDQITTLNMLAASGFLFASEVGDSLYKSSDQGD